MSFETSDREIEEREAAYGVLSDWVEQYPTSLPRSIVVAIIAVAGSKNDPLRFPSLHLLLSIFIAAPMAFFLCDGFCVLLNGCVDMQNASLLQSTLLTCLFYLNTKRFRQSKTLLDLQVVLDPLLSDELSKQATENGLSSPYYLANLAVLTLLRSWNGLLLFGSEMGGFSHYINTLATQGDDHPQLAKEILSTLFTLLGVPTPNLLNEDELPHHSSSWNECSLFVDRLGLQQETQSRKPHTNIMTMYLSLIVATCVKAKLPETLTLLIHHKDPDVAYLSRNLLSTMTLLADLFLPITPQSCRNLLIDSLLEDMSRSPDQAMKQHNLVAIQPSLVYKYPIVDHTTFLPNDLTDYFSWMALFENIVNSFCNNDNYEKPLSVTDYLCDSQFSNHWMVSETLKEIYENTSQFMKMLRQTMVRVSHSADRGRTVRNRPMSGTGRVSFPYSSLRPPTSSTLTSSPRRLS